MVYIYLCVPDHWFRDLAAAQAFHAHTALAVTSGLRFTILAYQTRASLSRCTSSVAAQLVDVVLFGSEVSPAHMARVRPQIVSVKSCCAAGLAYDCIYNSIILTNIYIIIYNRYNIIYIYIISNCI